jgi:hypothetical protein
MIKLLTPRKKKVTLVTLNTLKLKNNISDNENSISYDEWNDEMFESGHMRTDYLEDDTPLQARMNRELQYQYFELHVINNSDQ